MPVVVYTSKNTASKNIAEVFLSYRPKGIEVVDTKAESVLEVPNFESDYVVVLSSHKSRNAEKMITAHHPGNWESALMGGSPRTLNIAYGSRIKDFIKKAEELRKKEKMDEWLVVMEADHHGPTIEKPIIFVEIGSSEKEWNNKKAIEIVAEATAAMIKNNEIYEAGFAVGGGHYAKEFTSFVQSAPYAVGHILPKYIIENVPKEMLEQAIEKNVEKINKVFLLKEQTNARQKEKIKLFCQEKNLEYKEI